jgi:ion channel POLLUX/CASTOR
VRGALDAVDPGSYDSVVFMASDRLGSTYESDARTILGHLVLEKLFDAKPPVKRPSIVVELMSAENAELLGSHSSEKIVSPVIMSHILTQVALRRELHAVYVDLFGSGGGELLLRPPSAYALADDVTFAEIQSAAMAVGEVALGVRRRDTVDLCPETKSRWKLGRGDQIVAVARVT